VREACLCVLVHAESPVCSGLFALLLERIHAETWSIRIALLKARTQHRRFRVKLD
jgi:hypothetical protein